MLILPQLCGEISLNARCSLERSPGGEAEYLRLLLRRVDVLARENKIRRQERYLVFMPCRKEFKVITRQNETLVHLPGDVMRWRQDFDLRCKLTGVILRARFNLPENGRKNDFPVWLTAGIDEAVAGKEQGERYFSWNRDYSALRAIADRFGKLPDFGALSRFERLPEDLVMRRIFTQQSRLFLVLLSRRKMLDKVLTGYNAGKPGDFWIGEFASRREAQLVFQDLAAAELWNRSHHHPEKKLLMQLDGLKTVMIPELDEKQTPTGKMTRIGFAELANLLSGTKRPDAAEIRRYYGSECRKLTRFASPAVSLMCRELAAYAEVLGEDDDAADNFRMTLEKIRRQLEFEAKREVFLHQSIYSAMPVSEIYGHHFSVLDASGRAASTAGAEKFLDETERNYWGNY